MERIIAAVFGILSIYMLFTLIRPSQVERDRRRVQRNINGYKRRSLLKLMGTLILSPFRYTRNYIVNTRLLDSYSWYKSLSGNWTDSHCMMTLSPLEICRLDPVDFKQEYFGG